MNRQIKELESRCQRLEQSMERMLSKNPQITIENVNVHQPVLEKLEFRLDGLDIETLSGSLNLGNNFGAKIAEKTSGMPAAAKTTSDSSESAQAGGAFSRKPSPQQTDPSVQGVHRTSSGFRVTRS